MRYNLSCLIIVTKRYVASLNKQTVSLTSCICPLILFVSNSKAHPARIHALVDVKQYVLCCSQIARTKALPYWIWRSRYCDEKSMYSIDTHLRQLATKRQGYFATVPTTCIPSRVSFSFTSCPSCTSAHTLTPSHPPNNWSTNSLKRECAMMSLPQSRPGLVPPCHTHSLFKVSADRFASSSPIVFARTRNSSRQRRPSNP